MDRATVERTRPSSRCSSPAIVQPPGAGNQAERCTSVNQRKGTRYGHDVLVTLSLIAAGCSPLCITILAAPCMVCAASSSASGRGKPIITPPSAIASKKTQAKAGPEPASAVHASKCFSSRNRALPTAVKMERRICRSSSADGDEAGRGVRTVMPSRI